MQTVDHKIENCPCEKKAVGSDPGALKGFFSLRLNQRVLVEFLHLTSLSSVRMMYKSSNVFLWLR